MEGIVRTDMEVPLPPGIKGGTIVTTVVGMGPPLVGSEPTAMCAVKMGPLEPGPVGQVEGIPMMIGGMDIIPLLTIPP